MQATQTCSETWTGRPESYQNAALKAHYRETGRTQLPWTWVLTDCGNEMCLEPGHMLTQAPRALVYPRGVCVYCGFPSDTNDHLIPRAMSGHTQRRSVLTVPACRECNSVIAARGGHRISDRRAIAQEHLRAKHHKLLAVPDRTEAEIQTFGATLRTTIRANIRKRAAIRSRLAWPEDSAYDERAFQQSGIPEELIAALV